MIDALKGFFRRRDDEICPFCFEYYKLSSTPFRCGDQCRPKKDPVLERFWGDGRPRGTVIPPGKRFTRCKRCPFCRSVSRKRLCPACHSELPYTTGDYRNYIFAVIGAKESGKSHYIAVLIDQLRKKVGPELKILLEPLNDATMERYRNDFYNPVYRDHRTIDATVSARADRRVRRPLLYGMTFSGRGTLGRSTIRNAAVLVFFDTAGEDLNSEDVMSAVNRYIYRSDGIILLLDPLQLPRVRDRLHGTAAMPEVNTETSDIVSRTTRLIQKGRNLKATDKIGVPLALAFSKFDAVMPLVHAQSPLLRQAAHRGGFDAPDHQSLCNDITTLLREWDQAHLVQQVQDRYSTYGFFGLSALGCNPHETRKIEEVVPHRVEDPFLWLLAKNRLISEVNP